MPSRPHPEPSRALVRTLQVLLVLGSLGAWEAISATSSQAHFFFSRPSAIGLRLVEWIGTREIWLDMAATLLETILGFLGGVLLGLLLAFLCYSNRLAERVFMPFFGVANAMPRIVFGPIFVLWFGLGLTSKVVLGMSIVTFLVLFATFQGLREVDPALILRVRLLGGTSRDVLRHVLIPSALTWVFTSLRTGVGFALVGAVVGEYSGASLGLGHRIEFAEGMFDSTGIFAGLTLLSGLVVVLNEALELIEQRFRPQVEEAPTGSVRHWQRPLLLATLALVLALAGRSFWLVEQTREAPRTRVTMASAGKSLMGNLPATLAESLDFFRTEGLDVQVQDLKGGASAAKALIGGSADYACIALDHVLKARVQGQDLVYLMAFDRYPGASLIVDRRLAGRVRTVQDLKGLTLGVTSMGSGSHMALDALLVKSGVPLNQVQVVSAGTGTMPAALQQGSIQAAMHYDPFVTRLVLEGKGYVLFDLTTREHTMWLYGSEYPYLGLVTRREVLRSRPQEVQAVVNALVTAQRFLKARSPEAVARALPSDFGAEGPTLVKALEHTSPSFSPDGQVTPQQVQAVLHSLQDSGALPADSQVQAETVVDMGFLRRATSR